jgi:ATP-dependent Clp protease ATP-binding subunit ClpB
MSKHAVVRKKLDPTTLSAASGEFGTSLRAKIIGQNDGVQALIELYQVLEAGLSMQGRPVGNLLFLGPTGCGKTHIVEAAAEILFGDSHAVIKVDCAEFQHSHEIAKLIGSPPGYLGHRETHPKITQEQLARSHKENLKLSFLLFDEIEKASDALWALLLGMMDKATLTLGDNRVVDLSRTVIFLTSNLGGSDISHLMTGDTLGFVGPDASDPNLDRKIDTTAVEAARRKFSPEFMNRLDRVVVFHPLTDEQMQEVLNIELGLIQRRILESQTEKFLFTITDLAKEFLIKEGTDIRYGARHLKRALEKFVVVPMANLIATKQINSNSLLWIDQDESESRLSFSQDNETVLTTWLKEPVKKVKKEE